MMNENQSSRAIKDESSFQNSEQIEKLSDFSSLYIDNIYNNINILINHFITLSMEINKLSIEVNKLNIEIDILNKKKLSIGESFFLEHNNNIYNDIEEKEKRKYKKKKEKEMNPEKLSKFNTFWEIYDKKESRTICLNIWDKLDQEDIDAIIKTVGSYVRWKSDAQYRKMPSTYLRGRCWEDRIPSEFLQAPESQSYQLPKNAIY